MSADAAGAAADMAHTPLPPETVTVRPRRVLWAAWVGAVLMVALFVVIAILLRSGNSGTSATSGVYFRLADQVAMVMMGLLLAGGVLLLARPRVRADAEGIEVRNILATRRLPWEAVEGIAFPDGASWARLDLADYEYIAILAIQAVDGAHAVEGIRRVRALRDIAAARRDAERRQPGEQDD